MRRSGSESGKSVVDDTNRRKWDREEYAERARERELEEDDEGEFGSSRRRSLAMPAGPRAPLQQRDYQVDLTSQLGKTQVVTPIAPLNQQAGYYCNVCQCVVKDSANYLDHINGKKHQRALGMSMRVERSSLQQVQQRFEMLKRKKESQGFSEHDFDMRILKQQEEEEERKKARKERKKEKKKVQSVHGGDDDDGAAFDGDPELAAMMGFGGFGVSKK